MAKILKQTSHQGKYAGGKEECRWKDVQYYISLGNCKLNNTIPPYAC